MSELLSGSVVTKIPPTLAPVEFFTVPLTVPVLLCGTSEKFRSLGPDSVTVIGVKLDAVDDGQFFDSTQP